jgi:hypothetical protein
LIGVMRRVSVIADAEYIVVTIHPIKVTRHDFDFGRGKRTPQTLLLLDERDKFVVEARKFYVGLSDREVARRLRFRLSVYRDGRWRRTRSELWCPHPADRIEATLWKLLRARDAIPSTRTIRAALSRTEKLVCALKY